MYCSFVQGMNVFNLELCPNRQLYPTFKQCFIFIFLATNICVLSIYFLRFSEMKKRLGMSEDNRTPPPPDEGEQRTQPQDVEEGEVVGIVTTTGDVHVVEEQSTHFTTDSAQRLIQEIMFCSQDLDLIKEKNKEIEQRMKNMIDVLERI
ncbi:hypothetical protein AB205_0047970 [Aquarana catesbeiana]|uniref:Uncharacterized protein n=1 Tax=Aquarana catesbeiana TaxID=8400 RepID=A0A2G9RCH5_AQUCT|nr:hypothetical protein AB205_0047970 [Aquarana catesbeiana]